MEEEDFARFKTGALPGAQPMSVDITETDETEQKAACWDQSIRVYCRIHACLNIELRPWKEKDLQEFETAPLGLGKAVDKLQV